MVTESRRSDEDFFLCKGWSLGVHSKAGIATSAGGSRRVRAGKETLALEQVDGI